MKPTPMKPMIIIAHVEGSGTAVIAALVNSKELLADYQFVKRAAAEGYETIRVKASLVAVRLQAC